MPAITVSSLAKTFVTKRKAAGLAGSLHALVHPEQKTIDAPRGISFEMESDSAIQIQM